MASRTSEKMVKDVLMSDYGPKSDGTNPTLSPFIATAAVMVTRVATCAAAKDMTLTSEELRLIETWLAAHFYVMSDQVAASRSEAGASASHQGQTGMYLEASKYGQTALTMDYSGCLAALSKHRRATAAWLGLPPSEQTPIEQRS